MVSSQMAKNNLSILLWILFRVGDHVLVLASFLSRNATTITKLRLHLTTKQNIRQHTNKTFFEVFNARGIPPNKEVGGRDLDLTSSLEAKFGARSGQVHKIRGKFWEVLSPKDAKVGKKSQFWGHIWSSEGKIWGICHLYFWRQNLGLQQEFQRQNLGPSPPTSWYGSSPPWDLMSQILIKFDCIASKFDFNVELFCDWIIENSIFSSSGRARKSRLLIAVNMFLAEPRKETNRQH